MTTMIGNTTDGLVMLAISQNELAARISEATALGEEAGRVIGYDHGYEAGLTAGHDDGYSEGYDEGYSAGFSEGEDEAYCYEDHDGYESGYESGYDDARAEFEVDEA